MDEISADTGQSTFNPRAHRDWELVWSNESTPGVMLASFVQSVPTFSRRRNDPARCQLDHLSRDDQDHVPIKHQMHRVVTKCKSTRCEESGRPCGCRYKILICEPGVLARAYVEGEHTMSDPAVSSPKPIRLTNEMKSFIEDRLEEHASMTPLDLHRRVCKMVSTGRMEGPEPLDTQVQSHVKQWRYHNQRDTMQPVLDLCARSMVECIDDVQQSGKNLLILCDTKYEEGKHIPNLGTGHKASPFRIGFTCFTLLEKYVNVQRDLRCTTILHIDSTHTVVKQRYPVFVFEISDCSGTFFPVVYVCTSQRTGEDVGWCCAPS